MRKLGLWLMTICLIACLSFATVACGDKTSESMQPKDKITLSDESVSLEIYSEYTLTASKNVEGSVAWSSSDPAVATVDGGKISALKVGSTTITATAGKASATCTVNVTALSAMPNLAVDCNDVIDLQVGGQSREVSVTITYKGEEQDCDLEWSSENPQVATVSNDGVITPVGVGSTTVTVTTVCLGEILTKDITVVVKHNEQIILSTDSIALTVAKINDTDLTSDTFTAQAMKQGSVNTDVTLSYESSDPSVATVSVDDGEVTVTAVGKGTCEITVSYESQVAGTVKATVSVVVELSKITLDEVVETEYLGAETLIDVNALNLQGDFEGVFYDGERVDVNGKLLESFADFNKDSQVAVKIQTSQVEYSVALLIYLPYVPVVTQGDGNDAMPTYQGSENLGFPQGTETIYQIVTTGDTAWNVRLVTTINTRKDYVVLNFILSASVSSFGIWPGNAGGTLGYYQVTPTEHTAQSNANPDREIFVLNQEGDRPGSFKANTLYTLYFAIEDGETNVQLSSFSSATIYVANIECLSDSEVPACPEAPTPDPDEGGSTQPGGDPHPEFPAVSQGDNGAQMPVYDGADDLGFPQGTDTIYQIVTTSSSGWDKRLVAKVDSTYDCVRMDFVLSANISNLTVWSQEQSPTGSYGVSAQSVSPSAEAKVQDRKVFILGENNRQPSALNANTLYTLYFFLSEGETSVHIGAFDNVTVYVANIRCINEGEVPYDPTLPPPTITKGEERLDMPTFSGDVTELGFASGTVVYTIEGPDANNNKLVAQVEAGNNDYAKFDFVLSSDTDSIGMWITAKEVHLGYYSIKPASFTTDGHGDASRDIFVTDEEGNDVTAFVANKKYTLYVGLDGREQTIQLATWANLTVYVANFGYCGGADLPGNHVPPTVEQGKEISILFIGNSFSDDTEAYVVEILLELGYTTINVGNMYIGGCDIDTHYQNILSGAKAYDFRMRSHNGIKYTEYVPVSVDGKKQSLEFAITYKDWDVISLQQGSAKSGKADTYENLNALKTEVQNKATNPDVRFVFNMTWAYQADSTHASFPDYGSDQMAMYNAIVSAVQSKVDFTVVPNGTAIQNARTSFVGDNLTLDGHHLNLKLGRFIAGLTFVAKVTGEDITDFDYAPSGVNKSELAVAIESAKNALNTPFAVTESLLKRDPFLIPDTSLITAGGSNSSAVTVYSGNVTDLGFASGSEVYKYVGGDATTDKVAIKVDSTNYDYVDVQFVIASDDYGYFFMHGMKSGTYYNGGTSYVIDPSWIRLGDGNNSPSDRTIEVFDQNGNKINSLMSENTLYTIRVYVKEGELDQILFSKTGSIIYFANVTYGNEEDNPTPPTPEESIGQGDGNLPYVDGNVTEYGFNDGEKVQKLETETVGAIWGDDSDPDKNKEPTSGKTREELAAIITGEVGKYVTVRFSLSKAVSSGSLFYVWGLNDKSHTNSGAINLTTTQAGRIFNTDGTLATTLSANTVYVLELYIEGTNKYRVANIILEGMVIYFAPESIACSSESFIETAPSIEVGSIMGDATNPNAVSQYTGDETQLGFAQGSTVYEYVGVDSVSDKVSIKVDSKSYDFVEVQFIIASGEGYFFLYGKKDGNWHQGGLSYVVDPSNIRFSDNTASDRVIEVLDADGNKTSSLMSRNTLYTLRVYIKVGELDEVLIGQSGSTIYLANVKHGLVSDLPVEGPIKQGDARNMLAVYEGDETKLGFEKGTIVQYLVGKVESGWGETIYSERAVIVGEGTHDYISVDFVVLNEITSSSIFHVWPKSGAGSISKAGESNVESAEVSIVDENGFVITSIVAGKRYTLRVYDPGATHFGVGVYGLNTVYFANVICGTGKPAQPIVPTITAGGTNKDAISIYKGDETQLGFADGSIVYQYVGQSSSTDNVSIKVDSSSYDYVDVQLVIAEFTSSSKWINGFALNGSSYINGGAAYILDPSWIRVNSTTITTMDRVIEVYDANGVKYNSAWQVNTLYTLRFYIKAGNATEIQMRTLGTIYFANVTFGNDPVSNSVEIKAGDEKTVPNQYTGNVTALGFAEGSTVYEFTPNAANEVWDNRCVIDVDSTKECLSIEFALSIELYGTLDIYTVTDDGEPVLVASILAEGGIEENSLITVVIKDAEDNDVSDEVLVPNKTYTLYVYYNGADEVHITCNDYDPDFGGNSLYVANAEYVTE